MNFKLKNTTRGCAVSAEQIRDALAPLLKDRAVIVSDCGEVLFATIQGEPIRLYVTPYSPAAMRFHVNKGSPNISHSEWMKVRHRADPRLEPQPRAPRWQFSFAPQELGHALRFFVAKVQFGEGTGTRAAFVKAGRLLGVERHNLTAKQVASEWEDWGGYGYAWSSAGAKAHTAYAQDQRASR